MPNKVRTRIAPSPTGNLHVGTARTALFNYLFSRQNDGDFLLRIEDTDLTRSTKEFEEDIITGLQWLEIKWNGEIYRQSERNDVYKLHIEILKNKGLVYEEPAREGEGVALILKKPSGEINFTDVIRGEVAFAEDQLTDLVIQKPDGSPTYNFAVAVDDHEMKITHVIRGEDHIANTPKQIMVYRALGWELPKFAHLPLILAPDRSKLSKRHGATSLSEFKGEGYLPEAMVNFMALLGWHPKGEKEIFTMEELSHEFKLEDVQKGGAVFDQKKLDWLNQQHIQNLLDEEYKKRLTQFVGEEVTDTFATLTQKRVKTLAEARDEMKWLDKPNYDAELLVWKNTDNDTTQNNLDRVRQLSASIPDEDFSDSSAIERHIMPIATELGKGEVLWPMRVALSGKEKSPGPFELAAILGKDETLRRIDESLQKLADT